MRLNCAQAVLFACKKDSNVPDVDFEDRLSEFKAYGSGGHESGMCGAIYAAQYMFSDSPELQKEVLARFADATKGELECKPIRRAKVLTCHQCVAVAAELTEELAAKRVATPAVVDSSVEIGRS